MTALLLLFAILALGFDTVPADAAQPSEGAVAHTRIREDEIASLRKELTQALHDNAFISKRRKLKNIVRAAQALLEASSTPNHYKVLGIILKSQKQLAAMEMSGHNRKALFETCTKLADAPDSYSKLRLEADLLLAEKELAESGATMKKRAKALKALLQRYRGTAAEAKSLRMATMIALKLGSRSLEHDITSTLDERFADDPDMIEFRLGHPIKGRLDVVFVGQADRLDGQTIHFPMDTAGHLCIMLFWSKHSPDFETYLEQVHTYCTNYPGRFDVFSFNLDELADGGRSILQRLGFDWPALRLPGGKANQLYRIYGKGDPVGALVNAYGYVVLRPNLGARDTFGVGFTPAVGFQIHEQKISEDRYLAQLQSLFIGDFLVKCTPTPPSASWPAELKAALDAIQDCFVQPPLRYRLTSEQSLAHYTKAESLCAAAIDAHPEAPDLWRIRNCRIIALMGMWNMTFDPKLMERAAAEAKVVMAGDLPAPTEVVPRYCLAKAALRTREEEAGAVITRFVEQLGGSKAPPRPVAAACILALDAKSRKLHEQYRTIFLDKYSENQALYAFTAFLRNRHHRYRLLTPNHWHRERWSRSYIINREGDVAMDHLPPIKLKTRDGGMITQPGTRHDKLRLLLFIEPPAEAGTDFPVVLDKKGKTTNNDHVRALMTCAEDLADRHVNNGIDVIAVFLTDDKDRVDYLMEANGWTCQALMVPGGVSNHMVNQLGIFSADRVPNVFLLRRDGSIAWRESGLRYIDASGYHYAFKLGLQHRITICEVQHALRTLENGKYQEAAQAFAGPFNSFPRTRDWRSPRHHGRALAYVGMKDWDAALDAIDVAIDAHKIQHHGDRRPRRGEEWRKTAAEISIQQPCSTLAILWRTKADILAQLNRSNEASDLRKQAADPIPDNHRGPYEQFHQTLEAWRTNRK